MDNVFVLRYLSPPSNAFTTFETNDCYLPSFEDSHNDFPKSTHPILEGQNRHSPNILLYSDHSGKATRTEKVYRVCDMQLRSNISAS